MRVCFSVSFCVGVFVGGKREFCYFTWLARAGEMSRGEEGKGRILVETVVLLEKE